MSQTVDIIIQADDQASKKLEQVTKNIETNVKQIKEVGGSAKTSTEFVGALANALGGSELGSYASQLAGLTEKVSQFAEVQKAGGAGALVFKAGLVAAAGAAGFAVGNALGRWVFDTEKWEKELEKASNRIKEIAEEGKKLGELKFTRDNEEFDLIRNPEEKKQAIASLLGTTSNNIATLEGKVHKARETMESYNDSWIPESIYWRGDAIKQQLEETEATFAQLQQQREALRTMAGRDAEVAAKRKENADLDKQDGYIDGLRKELELLTAKDKLAVNAARNTVTPEAAATAVGLQTQIEAIKKQEEMTKKSDDYISKLREEVALLKASKDEIVQMEAAKNTFGVNATAEAEQLLRERDAIKEKEEADKKAAEESKRLADEKISQAKQIEQLRNSELQKLEAERIEMTKGKEAAHAYNLEKQGLSRIDAERIAREQAAIDRERQMMQQRAQQASKPKTNEAVPQLQATETRLLTIGDVQDVGQQQLQLTRDSNAQLQTIANQLAPVVVSLSGLVPGLGVLASIMGRVEQNTGAELEAVS